MGPAARRILLSVSLVLAGACSSRRIFLYTPTARSFGEPTSPDGVAVMELVDARGGRPLDHNLKLLALIPCVPFAVSHRDYPERTHLDDSDNLNGFVPTLDWPKAMASELEARRVFAKVRIVEGRLHSERYELRGRLFDCHVVEGYLTYGVSFLSVFLHIVGFPEGTVRCGVRLRFELFDRREGKVVWQKEITDTATRATWIYDSAEADHACELFTILARELLPPAAADLDETMKRRAQGGEPGRLETTP